MFSMLVNFFFLLRPTVASFKVPLMTIMLKLLWNAG